jgi:hypothetical protein
MEALIIPVVVFYLASGLLFGVFFAVIGVAKLDPVAKGSPITFRLLTIPAATALWPVLLVKILRQWRAAS